MTIRHISRAGLLAAAVLLAGAASAAPQATIIYTFEGGADGAQPVGDLLLSSKGSLIGLTQGGGSGGAGEAFALTPPTGSGKNWSKTILYGFTGKADGGTPTVGLTADAKGNLYGTTSVGGSAGYGTLFVLSPGKSGYSETVLNNLQALQRGIGGPLTFDSAGNLYGVAFEGGSTGCGAVVQFSPPSGGGHAWKARDVHDFSGADGCLPLGRLTFDAAGNLYGTTSLGGSGQYGSVYKITHTNQTWKFTTLHNFANDENGTSPAAGVSIAKDGTILGTTVGLSGPPNVFKGTPGKSSWIFKSVAAFKPLVCGTPEATLLLGASNTLFGTGSNPSCVFELQLGQNPAKLTVIGLPPAFPKGGLTSDGADNLYGATQQPAVGIGYGTIYQLKVSAK